MTDQNICTSEGCGSPIEAGAKLCEKCGMKAQLKAQTYLNQRLGERNKKLTEERNNTACENMRLHEELKKLREQG